MQVNDRTGERLPRNRPTFLRRLMVAVGSPWVLAAILLLMGLYSLVGIMPARYAGEPVPHLPALEMTGRDWFSWWPLQVLLLLLIVHMLAAIVGRTKFRLAHLGMLSVRIGVIIMAIGIMCYSQLNIEGDILLAPAQADTAWQQSYYPNNQAALYVQRLAPPGNTSHNEQLRDTPHATSDAGTDARMYSLRRLPRFNDYAPGDLNIKLHERSNFKKQFGGKLRLTIPGYIAHGEIIQQWTAADANPANDPAPASEASPALRLAFSARPTDAAHDDSRYVTLAADIPARRVVRGQGWAVEYLVGPSEQRKQDLNSGFAGQHGLVVRIPGQDFHATYPIKPGQTIAIDDTGYTLTVRHVGPYPFAFADPAYQGATDTCAVVQVQGHGKNFTRIVMHRYPEQSKDLVQSADHASDMPFGKQQAPDPGIELTYLDNTRAQYHLIADAPDDDQLEVIARFPNGHHAWFDLPAEQELPLATADSPDSDKTALSFHVAKQWSQAVRITKPVPTPMAQHQPIPKTRMTTHCWRCILLSIHCKTRRAHGSEPSGCATRPTRSLPRRSIAPLSWRCPA